MRYWIGIEWLLVADSNEKKSVVSISCLWHCFCFHFDKRLITTSQTIFVSAIDDIVKSSNNALKCWLSLLKWQKSRNKNLFLTVILNSFYEILEITVFLLWINCKCSYFWALNPFSWNLCCQNTCQNDSILGESRAYQSLRRQQRTFRIIDEKLQMRANYNEPLSKHNCQ